MKRVFVSVLALGVCAVGVRGMLAQGFQQPAPPAAEPVHKSADPILRNFTWRSIGPANMGGRIDDIAVVESNPSTYYIGFATGGVWKTTNNGTTFTPIFDDQRSLRSATSPSPPRTPTSSTSVPARRTTGRAPRLAPACTSRAMPEKPGSRSD